jgi:hypothetical protein
MVIVSKVRFRHDGDSGAERREESEIDHLCKGKPMSDEESGALRRGFPGDHTRQAVQLRALD